MPSGEEKKKKETSKKAVKEKEVKERKIQCTHNNAHATQRWYSFFTLKSILLEPKMEKAKGVASSMTFFALSSLHLTCVRGTTTHQCPFTVFILLTVLTSCFAFILLHWEDAGDSRKTKAKKKIQEGYVCMGEQYLVGRNIMAKRREK
jgi:hypothetical protein